MASVPPPPGGDLPPPGSPPPPPQPLQPYGQQYPYAPPYTVPDASGATPALVLGILSVALLPLACCCGFGQLICVPLGIIAVILGFSARSRIAASQGALGGSGKALAGIVTGAVGVVIAGVLFALVLLGVMTTSLINSIPTPAPT